MNLLKDLVWEERQGPSIQDSYPHTEPEAYLELMKTIQAAMEDEIYAYIDSLPYPTTVDDLPKPVQVNAMPDGIRMHLVEILDSLFPKEHLMEKTVAYCMICQDIINEVLSMYEIGWKRAAARLGISVEDLAAAEANRIKNN